MAFDVKAVRATRERMLLRLLYRTTTSMNAELIARLRAAGHPHVQPSFTTLLARIDTEGTSLSEIARRLGLTRQAVSQQARALEAAGIVERAESPSDGRAVLLRHTPAGRQLLLDAIAAMQAIEDEYAAVLGHDGVAELKDGLARLAARADPSGELGAGG